MINKPIEKYENLMNLLYQYDFYNTKNFYEYELLDEDTKEVFNDILNQLESIDSLISSHLFNYTIDRLNKVDLSIIRIAVYELIKKEYEAVLVLNQAIEMTKEYSDLDDEKQHKFTNKLLDSIYKSLK